MKIPVSGSDKYRGTERVKYLENESCEVDRTKEYENEVGKKGKHRGSPSSFNSVPPFAHRDAIVNATLELKRKFRAGCGSGTELEQSDIEQSCEESLLNRIQDTIETVPIANERETGKGKGRMEVESKVSLILR